MQDDIIYPGKLRGDHPQFWRATLDRTRQTVAETGTVQLEMLTYLHAVGLAEEVFRLIEDAPFGLDPLGAVNPGVIFFPPNRPMVRDIRFVGLCAKLGLCDYWVKSGRWPDCADQTPYDFKAEARRLAGPQI
jgi:hypothetical protein